MILSAAEIVACLRHADATDPLVVTPLPDLDRIGLRRAASIDLRLGTWFLTPRRRAVTAFDIHDPQHDRAESKLMKRSFVSFGERFVLHPGNFVLAGSLEWVRLPSSLAAYVVGRSGWGRRGLIVATATGVHPGYTGSLTLELANIGEIPIVVHPGLQIAQMFLHRVDAKGDARSNAGAYGGYGYPILGDLTTDRLAIALAEKQTRTNGVSDPEAGGPPAMPPY